MTRISRNVIGQLIKTSLADDTDPTPIIYIVEGEINIGTLDTWAKAQDMQAHSDISVSSLVWRICINSAGNPQLRVELPELRSYDDDDDWRFIEVTLCSTGEQAGYKIDLRS